MCLSLILASIPTPTKSQTGPQELIATGDLPPMAAYTFGSITLDNTSFESRPVGLGGVAYSRRKRIRPIFFDHQLNSARDIVFAAGDSTSGIKGAILLSRSSSRSLERIAQIGDSTPDGEVFTNFRGLSMNESSEILLVAETSGPSPSPGLPDTGLFLWKGNQFSTLLKAGDLSPLGSLADLSNPRLTDNGHVYFNASVRRDQGDLEQAIFKLDGQSLQPVVRKGDRSESGEEIVMPQLGAVNNGGSVAFTDTVGGSAMVFLFTGNRMTRAVKEGDVAPGTRFAFGGIAPLAPFNLTQAALSANNELALLGAFRRGNGSVGFGIYLFTEGGGIKELARAGQSVGASTLDVLGNVFISDSGVVYCAVVFFPNNQQPLGNSAVLRIAQNQRRVSPLPEAGATQTVATGNGPPLVINRQGDAVYEHFELKLGTNNAFFGISSSLNLFSAGRSEAIVAHQNSVPAMSRFYGFSDLAVNGNGDMAFIGNVGGGQNLFLRRENNLNVLVRRGQTISNDTLSSILRTAINEQGMVAFEAEHETGAGVYVLTGDAPTPVVRAGDVAFGTAGDPSAFYFGQFFELSINSNRQIAFITNLFSFPPNQPLNEAHAIFLALPAANGFTLQQIVDRTSLRIRNAQAIFINDLALGQDGTVVFTARAPQAEAVFVSSPPRPGQVTRTVTKIAESGAATPAGGTFSSASTSLLSPSVFFSPRINAGGTISFIGTFTTADNKTLKGIFSFRLGGALEKLVAEGDAVPGGTLGLLSLSHGLNASGDVAFFGVEPAGPALYVWRQATIQRVVGPDQVVGGGGRLTPSLLVAPAITNSGRIFFLGALVNNDSRLGFFAVDVN